MKKIMFCLICSYLLGSLNPSALIARIKHTNLRKKGTKNLGATNVMLNFGKVLGALVMLFDLFKAFFAVKITSWLVPEIEWLPLLAGCVAVVGHIFPFYLSFKGGKGLAAYGGMVLGVSGWIFLFLLLLCSILMIITNYSLTLVVSAAVLFPILVTLKSGGNLIILTISVLISSLMVFKFRENFTKIKSGEELRVRDYLKSKK